MIDMYAEEVWLFDCRTRNYKKLHEIVAQEEM